MDMNGGYTNLLEGGKFVIIFLSMSDGSPVLRNHWATIRINIPPKALQLV